MELSGEGWHRYAVLADDRVLLLPRDHRWVPGLEREAAALQLLAAHDIPAPRLLDRVEDPRLWPYPVLIISRFRAPVWSSREPVADRSGWERMLCSLAELIAGYHQIPIGQLPPRVASPAPGSPDPFEQQLPHFDETLDLRRLEKLGSLLAHAAELDPGRVDRWLKIIEPCLQMAPTLVHRDINEGQIMTGPNDQVIGLIDWESAGLGHPLNDFNFGEWGFGIWEWERDFAQLRRVCWQRYAAERGDDLPDWRAVHLLMTISCAPPPEGNASDWNASRRTNTLANLRDIDAHL